MLSCFCVEDGDIISITLPASQHTRIITVTRGPVTNRIHITESQLPSQQLPTAPNTAGAATPLYHQHSTQSSDTSLISGSTPNVSSVSSINLDALDLGSRVGAQENASSSLGPASQLRRCPSGNGFRVSDDVLSRYPPFKKGWTKRAWVVVIRGRDIGIFFDCWYVLRAVQSNANGSSF